MEKWNWMKNDGIGNKTAAHVKNLGYFYGKDKMQFVNNRNWDSDLSVIKDFLHLV